MTTLTPEDMRYEWLCQQREWLDDEQEKLDLRRERKEIDDVTHWVGSQSLRQEWEIMVKVMDDV